MHKKAYKDIAKKHVTFKLQNSFKKKEQKVQHCSEAIVESILLGKEQSEET